MAKSSPGIPPDMSAITPYLRIKGAGEAIAFYKKVFGAKTVRVMEMGDRIGHAEISIGGAKICLADEFPEMGAVGPKTIGKTSVTIMHYCADVDAVTAKAAKAGATIAQPPAEQFWGARMSRIVDPFGHEWMIQTHKEEVSDAEMKRRLSALMAGGKPAAARAPTKTPAKKASSKG